MYSIMLDLLRFARYAYRFEQAFRVDRWNAVRSCFHDDATYELAARVPTSADVLAILDRIVRRVARRLAAEAYGGAGVFLPFGWQPAFGQRGYRAAVRSSSVAVRSSRGWTRRSAHRR